MGKIKTALILAAGIGKRLKPITDTMPKCLIEVNEEPLISRNIEFLIDLGFEKIIIVTGHKSEQIEDEIKNYSDQILISTIWNPIYDKTNNIYSLWLANSMINEPFVLIESDLYLDQGVLDHFLKPDLIALEPYNSEKHNGSTAVVDSDGFCIQLNHGKAPSISATEPLFKTVNIYSFSQKTWNMLCDRLRFYIQQKNLNIFYEAAISDLIRNRSINLKMVDFSDMFWFEIDDHEDLKNLHNLVQKRSVKKSA